MAQKFYDIKQAMIEYVLSNTFPPTTDTIVRVFKDYGRKEKIKMANDRRVGVIIFQDSLKYMMVDTLQAIKSPRQNGFSLQTLDFSFLVNNTSFNNYEIVSQQKELFLSRQCDKYVFRNTKLNVEGVVWVWQKIPLKAEIKIDTLIQKIRAISINISSSIADSEFELPSKIEIVDPFLK